MGWGGGKFADKKNRRSEFHGKKKKRNAYREGKTFLQEQRGENPDALTATGEIAPV